MITATGQGLTPIEVTRDQWEQIVEAARKHSGDENLPLWSAMVNYYNICLPSIVTALSFTLWHLYQRIGGTQNETYTSYYDLPAFWVDACAVIDREIGRIDKVRADKAQREQRKQRSILQRAKQHKHGIK